MKPPSKAEIFETEIATYWFDENGILYGVSKKVERNLSQYLEVIELYKKLTKNGNKFCLLADSSNSMPMSKEIIQYLAEEQPKYIKAMAIVSDTPFGTSQVNTFLKMTFLNFPVMKFSNEKEAKKWLKEYL